MDSVQSVGYPAIVVDTSFGTSISVDLFRSNAVEDYTIIFTPGTLSGGTSPAWAYSASVPVIKHLNLKAGGQTISDMDGALLLEYVKILTTSASNGSSFILPVSDLSRKLKGSYITNTELDTYNYNQVVLTLTLDTLADLTTGSPTASSGSSLQIVENFVPKAAISGALHRVIRIQNSLSITQTGNNDFFNAIAQDGTYKSLMLFTTTSSSAPYANGSNTLVGEMQLLLNTNLVFKDTFFSVLRNTNGLQYGVTPDTGYALLDFFPNGLDLSNLSVYHNVDLRLASTVTSGVVYLLRTEYLS